MTEDRIRQIVREELSRLKDEEAEAQAESDYVAEEIAERRRKREERRRRMEEEERQRLEDRLRDLEMERR